MNNPRMRSRWCSSLALFALEKSYPNLKTTPKPLVFRTNSLAQPPSYFKYIGGLLHFRNGKRRRTAARNVNFKLRFQIINHYPSFFCMPSSGSIFENGIERISEQTKYRAASFNQTPSWPDHILCFPARSIKGFLKTIPTPISGAIALVACEHICILRSPSEWLWSYHVHVESGIWFPFDIVAQDCG